MTELEGKVAMITGGASGLGFEVARLLARQGAQLVIVDWDERRLAEAVQALESEGASVVGLQADVSKATSAADAVSLAHSKYGRLDILFNNAGIDPLHARSVEDTEESDWDRILAVNVKSAYLFARAAIPLMRSGERGGAIVNTASIAGLRPAQQECAYSVSKAALISLTKSIALDFAGDGIRANCICPGPLEMVMTDRRREMTAEQLEQRALRASSKVPLGRQGAYSELADAVVFLAGPASSYITGAALVADGGLSLT